MKFFKRSMVVGAVAAVLAFSACEPRVVRDRPTSSGSVALSNDDSLIYAADTDNGVLVVVDAKTKAKLAEVKVGQQPTRITVGTDDTIYVVNRGSRSVSVIRKGEWSEAMRLETGVEPAGLALHQDGKTLYVASATSKDRSDVGTLTAFDTQTLRPLWETPVGAEPRGVAVVKDRVYVTLFKDGDVAEVDAATGALLKGGTSLYGDANRSRVSSGQSAITSTSYKPRAMNDIIATPDGKRVFTPTVWARENDITVKPNRFGGYYAQGGPCAIGAVASAGIVTFDTGDKGLTPRVDDLSACAVSGKASNDPGFPSSALAPRSASGELPVQGPTVGVTSPDGAWVLVVNRESRTLTAIPATSRTSNQEEFDKSGSSIAFAGEVGAGADGIAVDSKGLTAYVYNQFDHRIDQVTLGSTDFVVHPVATVATDVLTPRLAEGRRLFFDARDARMSAANTNVACSTCHLEGRDDGHVWSFPDGPRQTPALAGRHLLATAPYHWTGEFKDLTAFNAHTVVERMGGSGLDSVTADKLDSFIDGLPVAENATAPMTPAATHGRQVFEKAGCNTCHTGTLLTNNLNADVGTRNPRDRASDLNAATGEFNVPSLAGISRSAPYLHDGSQATLEARVFDGNNQHGRVDLLTTDEKNDLVAYLKTL